MPSSGAAFLAPCSRYPCSCYVPELYHLVLGYLHPPQGACCWARTSAAGPPRVALACTPTGCWPATWHELMKRGQCAYFTPAASMRLVCARAAAADAALVLYCSCGIMDPKSSPADARAEARRHDGRLPGRSSQGACFVAMRLGVNAWCGGLTHTSAPAQAAVSGEMSERHVS
jgi:hypothetical protein